MTPHNNAAKGEIAKSVLMPGDPKRAKFIAESFLEDAKLVNDVRGALAYTGKYKGKEVSVMASGMGMPSMSIYAFELIHYFNVKKIIRIGTCGVVDESVKIPELILADNIYSESNFAYSFNDYKEHTVKPTQELNETIINTSKELGMNIHVGTMVTADVFGPYVGMDRLLNRMPEDAQEKIQETLQRIINEGSGGLICIIL